MRSLNSSPLPLAASRCSHSARSLAPRAPAFPPAARAPPPRLGDIVGDFERRKVPAKLLASGGDLLRSQGRAVRGGSALLVGCAIANDRLAADQRRPRIGNSLVDHLGNLGRIQPVAFAGMPAHRVVAGDPNLLAA